MYIEAYEIALLVAFGLAGVLAAAVMFVLYRKSKPHGNEEESQESEALDPETLADALRHSEKNRDAIQEWAGEVESLTGKVRALESQFAELHEFVNRNLKKMSTRAARAEALTDLLEQSKEIDAGDKAQSKLEFHRGPVAPKRGARLVRKV